MFVLDVGDQYGFEAADDEIIHCENDKLSLTDVDIDQCSRLVFIDAPMGTGKTYLAQEYLSQHQNDSVLARFLACNASEGLDNHRFPSPDE
jgi:predicted AAA+ superfamily ATPase